MENVIGKAIKSRYHSCVLAYGQSSSGKTHTMMGIPQDPGLTPRLCEKIFDYLQEAAVGDEISNLKISVRCVLGIFIFFINTYSSYSRRSNY